MAAEDLGILQARKMPALTVTWVADMFSTKSQTETFPQGASVAKILSVVEEKAGTVGRWHVVVDGIPLNPEQFDVTVPRPDALIVFNNVPSGGGKGKSVFGIILGVAMAAFGVFNPAFLELTALGRAGMVVGGVMGVASGIQSLLAKPPRLGDLSGGRSSPLGDVTGTRNELGQGKPWMRNFGKNRVFPYYATKPFVNRHGEQWIDIIYDFGHGPQILTNLKLGETDIADFPDSIGPEWDGDTGGYRIHPGYDDDEDYSIVSATASETAVTREFERGTTDSQIITTETDTESISLDFFFERGLLGYEQDGDEHWVAVDVLIEWKPVEDSSWINLTTVDYDTALAEDGIYDENNRHLFERDARSGEPGGHQPLVPFHDAWDHTTFVDFPHTWQGLPDAPGVYRFVGDDGEPMTRGLFWTPTGGDISATQQYDVRVTRHAEDNWHKYRMNTGGPGASAFTRLNDHPVGGEEEAYNLDDDFIWSDFIWTVLRSIKSAVKNTHLDNHCLVEMRIKQSPQAQGMLESFNAEASSVLPTYSLSHSPAPWGPDTRASGDTHIAESQKFGDVLAEIMRGGANAQPFPDARIDSVSLNAWNLSNVYSDGDRLCNIVLTTQRRLYDQMRDIAGAGRASITRTDGKYGVVVEEPRSTVVAMFGPFNCSNMGSTTFYKRPVHGLRVGFINNSKSWQTDEILVYGHGYGDAEAVQNEGKELGTIFASLELYGAMTEIAAAREGAFQLASGQLQREIFHCDSDIENIVVTRGDLVRYVTPSLSLGHGQGRLVDLTINGSDELVDFTLDNDIDRDPSIQWGVRLRKSDNLYIVQQVTHDPTNPAKFTLLVPTNPSGVDPAIGDMAFVGLYEEESRPCIVKSIALKGDLSAHLEFVDYIPEIFDTDATPPAWDAGIVNTIPQDLRTPPKPVIFSANSSLSARRRLADGSSVPRIVLAVGYTSTTLDISPQYYQAQFRTKEPIGSWKSIPVTPADNVVVYVEPVVMGRAYDVRIRTQAQFGEVSAWTYLQNFTVGADDETGPPRPVTNLRVAQNEMLTWDYENPPTDLAGFIVKSTMGTAGVWEIGTQRHQQYITGNTFPMSRFMWGEQTIQVAPVDDTGLEGDPVDLTVTISEVQTDPAQYLLGTDDVDAAGYTGTKTDCSVSAGAVIADPIQNASAAIMYWSPDWETAWKLDASLHWGIQSYEGCIYEDSWDITVANSGAMFVIEATMQGAHWNFQYKLPGDTNWQNLDRFIDVPLGVATQTIDYRIQIWGADVANRPTIDDLNVRTRARSVVRHYSNVFIDDTGSELIDEAAGDFRAIKVVTGTVVYDATDNTGRSILVLDRDATNGPDIEVEDSGGTRVKAYVDFTIEGYD